MKKITVLLALLLSSTVSFSQWDYTVIVPPVTAQNYPLQDVDSGVWPFQPSAQFGAYQVNYAFNTPSVDPNADYYVPSLTASQTLMIKVPVPPDVVYVSVGVQSNYWTGGMEMATSTYEPATPNDVAFTAASSGYNGNIYGNLNDVIAGNGVPTDSANYFYFLVRCGASNNYFDMTQLSYTFLYREGTVTDSIPNYNAWVNAGRPIPWANGVQNAAPTCSIVTPTNNQIFTQGDNVPFSVNATDDSAIDSVQLYIDGNLLTTMTTAPYDYILPTDLSTPIGIYSVYAIAYDDNGLTTQSSTIQIEIVENTAAVSELLNVDVAIYPNPTSNVFTIEGENIKQVEILNIVGDKLQVLDAVSNNMKVNLSDQPNGVYFVKMKINDKWITKKVIRH